MSASCMLQLSDKHGLLSRCTCLFRSCVCLQFPVMSVSCMYLQVPVINMRPGCRPCTPNSGQEGHRAAGSLPLHVAGVLQDEVRRKGKRRRKRRRSEVRPRMSGIAPRAFCARGGAISSGSTSARRPAGWRGSTSARLGRRDVFGHRKLRHMRLACSQGGGGRVVKGARMRFFAKACRGGACTAGRFVWVHVSVLLGRHQRARSLDIGVGHSGA